MDGQRERARGGCGFSSLVKQNKKAKICFVIHIAGEKKLLFYFYFVIVKQKFINGLLITTDMLADVCCGYRAKRAAAGARAKRAAAAARFAL